MLEVLCQVMENKLKGSVREKLSMVVTTNLTSSVASLRRKLLNTTRTEKLCVHTNSESCNSDHKKLFFFQTNHSDIT